MTVYQIDYQQGEISDFAFGGSEHVIAESMAEAIEIVKANAGPGPVHSMRVKELGKALMKAADTNG